MPQLTLSTMEARVAAELGIDATGDYKSIVDSYLNEGVERFLLLTRCYSKEFSATLTAGEDSYSLSPAILQMLDAWGEDASGSRRLVPVSLYEINLMRARQDSTSGGPVRFYAVSGLNLLLLYPAAGGGEKIKGVYVPRPATLANANDSPSELPPEFHHAPVSWCCYRMASMDDDQSSGMGQSYKMAFHEDVALARKMLRRRTPQSKVTMDPTGARIFYPRTPDTDVG